MNNKDNQKKVLGIILIIIGVVSVGAGIIYLVSSKKPDSSLEEFTVATESRPSQQPSIETDLIAGLSSESGALAIQDVSSSSHKFEHDTPEGSADVSDNEASEDNYAKGIQFEEYVVSRFGTKSWTIKDWRGDKGVNGRYAEANMYPDLEMKLKVKDIEYVIAIECKWRSSFDSKDKIKWSYPDQIERYNSFSASRDIPVFVFIGIGGTPSNPEQLYVVPLKQLTSPNVHQSELSKYMMKSQRQFFYDVSSGDFRRNWIMAKHISEGTSLSA